MTSKPIRKSSYAAAEMNEHSRSLRPNFRIDHNTIKSWDYYFFFLRRVTRKFFKNLKKKLFNSNINYSKKRKLDISFL